MLFREQVIIRFDGLANGFGSMRDVSVSCGGASIVSRGWGRCWLGAIIGVGRVGVWEVLLGTLVVDWFYRGIQRINNKEPLEFLMLWSMDGLDCDVPSSMIVKRVGSRWRGST